MRITTLHAKDGTLEHTTAIENEVGARFNFARWVLAREITGRGDVCLTCSFQAEGVLLARLASEIDPTIPILFLDTGYHFPETIEYRDRIVREWNLNLVNIVPEKTVEDQEAEFGPLYRTSPDHCCRMRKVEPLFKALAGYRGWITGLRETSRGAARISPTALCSRFPGANRF